MPRCPADCDPPPHDGRPGRHSPHIQTPLGKRRAPCTPAWLSWSPRSLRFLWRPSAPPREGTSWRNRLRRLPRTRPASLSGSRPGPLAHWRTRGASVRQAWPSRIPLL
ncbi:hypothetical protein B484DRAFT_459795 [Ochromonadaceae sp. CCMP2298]|nr:hypothetical protein B484DRAFT_459795 [Ochromonadaceae sp. CCMP2298]